MLGKVGRSGCGFERMKGNLCVSCWRSVGMHGGRLMACHLQSLDDSKRGGGIAARRIQRVAGADVDLHEKLLRVAGLVGLVRDLCGFNDGC